MRIVRSLILTTIVLVPSLGSTAELTKDSLATVKKNVDQKKAVLVDVREKSEWNKGHVKGAIFLPLSALQEDAKTLSRRLPKDKIVYTHCVVGKRCVTAGNFLEKLGYEVRPIKPGYKELVAAGFQSEK
ncbi:MAG: rhodanese-like domain-containing protein [Pirellulales bacterium]